MTLNESGRASAAFLTPEILFLWNESWRKASLHGENILKHFFIFNDAESMQQCSTGNAIYSTCFFY